MIEKLIEEFAQSYTFDAIENKEFDSFKVNGMDFEVKAYDAQFLGRVSSMKGRWRPSSSIRWNSMSHCFH